jgi:hypothetical protein
MTLTALLHRHQTRVGPRSVVSLTDLDRDLALITKRGRTWVQYQRDVSRLPLARHLYLEGVTAEMRGAGFKVLRRLVIAEIEDMLAGMHVSDPTAINRYGRMLLCGIISMEDRIRQMQPKIPWGEWSQSFPYPLNEFHEFETGIRRDLQRIWTRAKLGERILRALAGAPRRPGNEEYDMRQEVLHEVVAGRLTDEDWDLLTLVWSHDPRGGITSQIAHEVWEEVCQVLTRYDPPVILKPDACRKRFERILRQLRRDLTNVPDIIDAIMARSRPE